MAEATVNEVGSGSVEQVKVKGMSKIDLLRAHGLLLPLESGQLEQQDAVDLTAACQTIVGTVVVKRQAGKEVVLSVVPMGSEGQGQGHCSWSSGVPGQAVAVQLVIGQTLQAALGEEVTRALCKVVKVGDVLAVRGTSEGVRSGALQVSLSSLLVYQDPDVITMRPAAGASSVEVEVSACVAVEQTVSPSEEEHMTLQDIRGIAYAPCLLGEGEEEEVPDPGPLPVLLVDDATSSEVFCRAVQALLADCALSEGVQQRYNPVVVGMDTEWRPYTSEGVQCPVETLQLSTRSAAFVLDMPSLCSSLPAEQLHLLGSALGALLGEPRVLKLGFEIMGDLDRLAASYGQQLPALLRWCGALDLSPLARIAFPGEVTKKRCGLSAVSRALLGKPMDKTMQCSAWHLRPLSAAQLAYGALDAAVLIALYDRTVRAIHSQFPSAHIDRYLEKRGLIFNVKFQLMPSTMTCRALRWPRQGKEPPDSPLS